MVLSFQRLPSSPTSSVLPFTKRMGNKRQQNCKMILKTTLTKMTPTFRRNYDEKITFCGLVWFGLLGLGWVCVDDVTVVI